MVAHTAQNISTQRFLIIVWVWLEKWGLPINLAKYDYLVIGQEALLNLSFFPDGFCTSTCVRICQRSRGLD